MDKIKEKGQSLVELGISFTILMFLLSGVVEFGTAFFQYVQLRDAVQEGALYGSACNCDVAEIEERVRWASNSPIDLQNDSVSIVVTVETPAGFAKPYESKCEQDAIEVRAIYSHKIFMPFMPKLLGREDILLNAAVTNTVLFPICGGL